MRVRVHRVTQRFTLRGYDLRVLLSTAIAGLFGYQFSSYYLQGTLARILAGIALAYLTFRVGNYLAERTPPRFLLHLMQWANSPNYHKIGPDTRTAPLIVHPELAARAERTAQPSIHEERKEGDETVREDPQRLATG